MKKKALFLLVLLLFSCVKSKSSDLGQFSNLMNACAFNNAETFGQKLREVSSSLVGGVIKIKQGPNQNASHSSDNAFIFSDALRISANLGVLASRVKQSSSREGFEDNLKSFEEKALELDSALQNAYRQLNPDGEHKIFFNPEGNSQYNAAKYQMGEILKQRECVTEVNIVQAPPKAPLADPSALVCEAEGYVLSQDTIDNKLTIKGGKALRYRVRAHIVGHSTNTFGTTSEILTRANIATPIVIGSGYSFSKKIAETLDWQKTPPQLMYQVVEETAPGAFSDTAVYCLTPRP